MEAMQANTIDVVGRMKEIAQVMKTPDDVLQSHGVTTENIEVNCRRMGGGRRARSPVLWHHARRGRGLGVGDVNLAVASDAWRSWRNFLWLHDEASGLTARQGPNSMTTFFLGGR
ncbi:uncharacterized protein LOC124665339 [Lolium rigidum]|uniref:uncharacterized protein LOC124665339 n=1 Tax=Lolium rigidum TaxID=89674 RepID=UPI001F5D48EA|nr:uncharacterized protein LOC124665339 [Lolium rigidum]